MAMDLRADEGRRKANQGARLGDRSVLCSRHRGARSTAHNQNTFDLLIEAGLKVSIDDIIAHQVPHEFGCRAGTGRSGTCGDLTKFERASSPGTDPGSTNQQWLGARTGRSQGTPTGRRVAIRSDADIGGGNGLSPLACAA